MLGSQAVKTRQADPDGQTTSQATPSDPIRHAMLSQEPVDDYHQYSVKRTANMARDIMCYVWVW